MPTTIKTTGMGNRGVSMYLGEWARKSKVKVCTFLSFNSPTDLKCMSFWCTVLKASKHQLCCQRWDVWSLQCWVTLILHNIEHTSIRHYCSWIFRIAFSPYPFICPNTKRHISTVYTRISTVLEMCCHWHPCDLTMLREECVYRERISHSKAQDPCTHRKWFP